MKTINIKFPLTDDVEKNRLFGLNSVSKDALTSNLVLLLLTEKGERYYEPDFGTSLKKFLFEPKDDLTMGDIERDIRETVKKFIPQLSIKQVQFFSESDDLGENVGDNELRVVVDFTYTEDVFSESGRLELTI